MSTHNLTGVTVTSGVPAGTPLPRFANPNVGVMEKTIDLTGSAITEDDVYQCLPIPANTLVKQVQIEIITAAVGTTLTMDVGDASGDNSWDNDVDGKGVAGTITNSIVGTDAYAAAAARGKMYSTADTIDVTMDTATSITAGPKFYIRASYEFFG